MSASLRLINFPLINTHLQVTCHSADSGAMFEKRPATSGLDSDCQCPPAAPDHRLYEVPGLCINGC